jgi:Glycosyltransferase family 87
MSYAVELEAKVGKTLERNLLLRISLVPIWTAVVIEAIILVRALPARAHKWDYSIYYSSALAMREGMNPYTTDLTPLAKAQGFELGKINHATDPPTFVMCFVPITLLPPRAGFYVWTGINAFAFLASIALLFRWTSGLSLDFALAIAGLAILFPPVIDHLIFGQNKMLLVLMFVLMLRWLQRGYDARAGFVLALATLLRAFPLLLILYLVIIKRWRALFYTALGLCIGGLLTLGLSGIGSTLSFLLAPSYLTEQWREALPGNIALGPTVSRMFWYFFGIHLGEGLNWIRRATCLLAELGLLGLTVRASLKSGKGDPDGRTFCLWMLTAILISPTSWFYYLVLLTIPLVKFGAAAREGRASARAVWAGILCYAAAWLNFAYVDLNSPTLALHPNTFIWRIGASPIGVLAYISLYWFAVDRIPSPRSEIEDEGSRTIMPEDKIQRFGAAI